MGAKRRQPGVPESMQETVKAITVCLQMGEFMTAMPSIRRMRSAIAAASVLALAMQVFSVIGRTQVQDYYPDSSRKLHEEGVTRVKACVDERGKLTSEPVVTLSSGHPRLDKASLKLAKAGSGRYKPAMQDGKPIAACFEFNVAWKLTQQPMDQGAQRPGLSQ